MRNIITGISCFVMMFATISSAQYSQFKTRSLLAKDLYYISDGKIGKTRFWSIHLGKHDLSLTKEFPGEGPVTFNAGVNFSFLSSQYIEGKGYSSRGEVSVEAEFGTGDSLGDFSEIELDSIDYIYKSGRLVKLIKKEALPLKINAEGTILPVRSMVIRSFVYNKEYGELNHDKDITVTAISFTREGINRALKKK